MLFLTSTLAAGVAPKVSAHPVKRTIVDAQVHLWKTEEDWRVLGMKPQMAEPFTIEKLVPLMDQAGVDRVVVVSPGYRNDYALEAAKRYPNRFAVMGTIPLKNPLPAALLPLKKNPLAAALLPKLKKNPLAAALLPKLKKNPLAAALLPKWKEQPGMLGVRLTDSAPDWFWSEAEKAGLPVMFLTAGRNAELARAAERHPRLQVIVDHMGVSADMIKKGRLADAISQTASLAKYSNVSVKLSGAPNYSSEAYPFRDFTPHIKRLFDAYGPKRCYWGTDITYDYDKATYKQRITHFTEELSFLSEEDKDWVMGKSILERLRWA